MLSLPVPAPELLSAILVTEDVRGADHVLSLLAPLSLQSPHEIGAVFLHLVSQEIETQRQQITFSKVTLLAGDKTRIRTWTCYPQRSKH